MVLETLRYAEEVNKAASYFRDIGDAKPDEELLELAETLIQKKTAPFDARVFHDRYIDALKDLVQRKLKAKGGKVTPEEEPARPSGSNVVDLMAALKKSLEKPEGKRSEEHTSELQSLMRNSYAVFCWKKKITNTTTSDTKPQITSNIKQTTTI